MSTDQIATSLLSIIWVCTCWSWQSKAMWHRGYVFAPTITSSRSPVKRNGTADKVHGPLKEALMIWLSLQHLQFSGWTLAVGVWVQHAGSLIPCCVGGKLNQDIKQTCDQSSLPFLQATFLMELLLRCRGVGPHSARQCPHDVRHQHQCDALIWLKVTFASQSCKWWFSSHYWLIKPMYLCVQSNFGLEY